MAIRMPETTSRPKAIVVSHAASPIVKDGNMMGNEAVKANCRRDSNKADKSIALPFATKLLTARERRERLYRRSKAERDREKGYSSRSEEIAKDQPACVASIFWDAI